MHQDSFPLSLRRYLGTIPIILLLNKQDRLARKIKNGARLEDYFPDFADYAFPATDSREKSMRMFSSISFGFASDDINADEDNDVTRAKYFLRDQFLVSFVN